MKCPHCSESVSIFSKEMNKFGKSKVCPKCCNPIRLYVSLKWGAILLIPAVVTSLLLKPLFINAGLSGSLSTGLMCGILALLCMRLKVPKIKESA
ncbi:hypothetical protein SAMN06297229_2242 [Pseudidiomarina planktonica]|uniref:Cxxc_20_cxxc protein n=1 Tax=Pseudidiomarina planktonica TaxID=1323738 RepID=A0A1Y6FXA3_9GAMM|nr:hypothetical protein SAMN06297229_2242 [Pseudidiomarina planktonica]